MQSFMKQDKFHLPTLYFTNTKYVRMAQQSLLFPCILTVEKYEFKKYEFHRSPFKLSLILARYKYDARHLYVGFRCILLLCSLIYRVNQ